MSPLAVFGITSDGANLVVNLLLLFLVVFWIALVYWTFADARRRIADPMLIGCATAAAMFPFVGTLVYMIVRPPEYLHDVRERELEIAAAEVRLAAIENLTCSYCNFRVEQSFLRCPSCLRRLKEPCVTCHKPLDPSWKICPYCESEIGQPAPQPRRRARPRERPAAAAPEPERQVAAPERQRQPAPAAESSASGPAGAREPARGRETALGRPSRAANPKRCCAQRTTRWRGQRAPRGPARGLPRRGTAPARVFRRGDTAPAEAARAKLPSDRQKRESPPQPAGRRRPAASRSGGLRAPRRSRSTEAPRCADRQSGRPRRRHPTR